MNEEVRSRRVAALDTFASDVAALLAGTPIEAEAEAFAAMLTARPQLAAREGDGQRYRLAELAVGLLRDVDLVRDDAPSRAGSSTLGADADWYVVTIPVFERHDPQAFDALWRLTGGAPSRTTVLVDGLDRLDDNTAGARDVLCRSYADDEALRFVARRFLPLSMDLWSRAVAVDESDSRALAALAIGDVSSLNSDLASASRFVHGDVGRAGEVRSRELDRLGMVGLRRALADSSVLRSVDLLRGALLDAAGASAAVASLRRDLVDGWPAARELRAAATAAAMIEPLRRHDRRRARDLADSLRRFEQGSEAAMADALRRWRFLLPVAVRADLLADLAQITDGATMIERLGVDAAASPGDALVAAAQGSEQWRSFAASPLATPSAAVFAEAVARWYEVICSTLAPTGA